MSETVIQLKIAQNRPPAPFWHFSRGVDHCSRGSNSPTPPAIFTLVVTIVKAIKILRRPHGCLALICELLQ